MSRNNMDLLYLVCFWYRIVNHSTIFGMLVAIGENQLFYVYICIGAYTVHITFWHCTAFPN